MIAAFWYLATAFNTALAMVLIARQRHSLIRPSVQVAFFYLLFLVLPLCWEVQEVEAFLPDFFSIALVLQSLVAIPLATALVRNDTASLQIWQCIAVGRLDNLAYDRRQGVALIVSAIFILTWYLSVVPLTSTGLYVTFTNPAASALAREDSFKLLESAPLRYAFAMFSLAIAPMLLVLTLAGMARSRKSTWLRRHSALLFGTIVLFLLTATVSLSGARSFAVTLWLSAIAAIWLLHGLRFRMAIGLLVGAIALLLVPVTLTLAREGRLADLGIFWEYFRTFIIYRIFTAPAEVGVWYVHYAQTEGSIGIAAVPKLAELFGYIPTNIPNLIGRTYYGGTLLSINANAGFGFTYYAYFGVLGWAVSILGTLCLDFVLLVYRRLRGAVLLATLSAASVSTLSFTYSDFTTVLVTNGFLIAPAIAWVLCAFTRKDGGAENLEHLL